MTHIDVWISSEDGAIQVDLWDIWTPYGGFGKHDEFLQKVSVDTTTGKAVVYQRDEVEDELQELHQRWSELPELDERKEWGTY
jgi:hypothetical protein